MGIFKAIFFDVDDTLFPTTKVHTEASHKGMKELLTMMRQHKQEELRDLSDEDGYKLIDETYNKFKVGHKDLYTHVVQRLNFEYNLMLDPMMITIFEAKGDYAYYQREQTVMESFEDVSPSLLDLHHKYQLGIITNGAAVTQAYKFVKLNITHFFKPEFVFISDVIGIRKPDPNIFKLVLKKHKLHPHECVYVGDNRQNDIDPAWEAGLITIHIKREGGKHSEKPSEHEPCFTVHTLPEIVSLLEGNDCHNNKETCKNMECPFKRCSN